MSSQVIQVSICTDQPVEGPALVLFKMPGESRIQRAFRKLRTLSGMELDAYSVFTVTGSRVGKPLGAELHFICNIFCCERNSFGNTLRKRGPQSCFCMMQAWHDIDAVSN